MFEQSLVPLQFPSQDGTSQASRTLKALDPTYVSVDERSLRDLLSFAEKYERQLRYFNAQNIAEGDWGGFLLADELDDLTHYLEHPQLADLDSEEKARFGQPHRALFLTFLQLLRQTQIQMNGLTRRHLDFYYRTALQLALRKGIPNQAHVLVELAQDQEQFVLPGGTLLKAGQDSVGNDLFYRTDQDLHANQASVASLKSLFIEQTVIGLAQVRENPHLLMKLFTENSKGYKALQYDGPEQPFIAMLLLVLGTPPEAGLPPYKEQGDDVTEEKFVAFLDELDQFLGFIIETIHMPISTFRTLMQLKSEQDDALKKDGEWSKVNHYIEIIAQERDNGIHLAFKNCDNFEHNIREALGLLKDKDYDEFFKKLPGVDSFYDLYRRRNQEEVKQFIEQSIYLSVEDFTAMMHIVDTIDARWRQIYQILRAAAVAKGNQLLTSPPNLRTYDPKKFDKLIRKTLGKIKCPELPEILPSNSPDCYFDARRFEHSNKQISKLEHYFHLSAEDFIFIRSINQRSIDHQKDTVKPQPWEWEQVYEILEGAHAKLLQQQMREAMEKKWDGKTGDFNALILFVLGDPDPGDPLPEGRTFADLNLQTDRDYIHNKLFLEMANFTYLWNIYEKSKKTEPDITSTELAITYDILELAQTRKRGLSLAQIEKWDNLYAAADATQVQAQPNLPGDSSRWVTFGQGYSKGETPGNIGFAISSPLLMLAEGKRTITLTLAFQRDGFDKGKATIKQAIEHSPSPFRFLLSTEKEMIAIENVSLEIRPHNKQKDLLPTLEIVLTLDEKIPPIMAPYYTRASTTSTGGVQNEGGWPVLQMMLANLDNKQQPSAGPLKAYPAFRALVLEQVNLKVKVEGLTNLTLQNDDGVLDPKKPFEPFGISPVVGSSFYFAHPELCAKRLDELTLKIDWLGAPDNFHEYYMGYADYDDPIKPKASPIKDNTSFKATLKLYDDRSLLPICKLNLFNADKGASTVGAKETNTVDINRKTITHGADGYDGDPGYQRDLHILPAKQVLNWNRYWQIELLDPDFFNEIYPFAAAGCAMKMNDGKPAPVIINPPYLPKMKSLTINYMASLHIDFKKDSHLGVDQLHYVEPFGTRLLQPSEQGCAFLPQFENQGELFIGIQDLKPPQSLALLFQMADGSANPDLPHQKINWSVLNGNIWISLEKGQLISDTTNGLLHAGIIQFALPVAQPSTLLPAGFYWIRATIAKNSRSVADTVAISAQAVSATFVEPDTQDDHLEHPLQAGSITGLAEPLPQVQAIHQPYSAFGGTKPEQASSFYTRVSERLRHKDRALACWDYEHIVLDAFPEIYKVKCLPVGASPEPRLAEIVQIIVIPNLHGIEPSDPFEPKVSADVLSRVRETLAQRTTPFAQFQVKNPTYIYLEVRLAVRLRSNANPAYDKERLNDEIKQYLSPWAYDPSADIVFGGQIDSGKLINFLQGFPYVEYVANLKFFTSAARTEETKPTPYDPAKPPAFAPDVILVSAPSHQIDLITDDGYQPKYFTGIGYMKIGFDFQIG